MPDDSTMLFQRKGEQEAVLQNTLTPVVKNSLLEGIRDLAVRSVNERRIEERREKGAFWLIVDIWDVDAWNERMQGDECERNRDATEKRQYCVNRVGVK